MSNMPSIATSDLQINVACENDPFTVKFAGEIDMEDPCALIDPFFDQLHQIISSRDMVVHVDLKELKFVNSSGIKALIHWIGLAKKKDSLYKICFHCNRDYTWQQMSLSVIQLVAPTVVSLEN